MRPKSMPFTLLVVVAVSAIAVLWILRADREDKDQALSAAVASAGGVPEGREQVQARAESSALVSPPEPLVEQESPVVAAEPLSKRTVGAKEVWDGLYRATERCLYGELTSEQAVSLATDVALLMGADPVPDGDPQNGVTTYTLLNDANGTVKLYANAVTSEKVAEYTIRANLNSQPGYFTGYPEDRADNTKLDIVFDLDASAKPKNLSLLTQLEFHHDSRLFTQLVSRGQPIPIGGGLRVGSEKTVWQPMTLTVTSKADGTPQWNSSFGEPVEIAGSIGGSGAEQLESLLKSAMDS